MAPEKTHKLSDVFGINRDLPLTYVERKNVDEKLLDNLTRERHIVIFGSSKQGKTCLRKHCLKDEDYIVVSCQNSWTPNQLHSAILKAAGYVTHEGTTKTGDGRAKLGLTFSGKIGVPGIAEGRFGISGDLDRSRKSEEKGRPLEIDPQDPNDIIAALAEIKFANYILLEDFHYLPQETQNAFAYSLKAFHEASKLTFIIVAVWREENRLILFNGDLAGRVIAIDADEWKPEDLEKVIAAGESLLNVSFERDFRAKAAVECLGSVYILQECCRRACEQARVVETQNDNTVVGQGLNASQLIREIVNEESGRYKSFLQNIAGGFQETRLDMYRWLLYPVITAKVSELQAGIGYRDIRTKLQAKHEMGKELKAGNITQALLSLSALQAKKDVKPFIFDYDRNNLLLTIVDRGFLIWMSQQDRGELLDLLDLPKD